MIECNIRSFCQRIMTWRLLGKGVEDNGHKTDGFQELNFKAYLITESGKDGNFYNCYAPLYIWNGHEGMNKFIFEEYYDNILQSFGWQQINIGVPLVVNLKNDFKKCRYVVEYEGSIFKVNH